MGTLYEALQDGRSVFLDASTDGAASRLVEAVAPSVRRVAVDTGTSMLVRPDACVAWAGDGDDTDGLAAALRRWRV